MRVWKDASVRARDRCKPCSTRQGHSGKRTKCCLFRCPHRALLVADSLEVNARTPSKMRRLLTLGMQKSPIMNRKCSLRKDPCQPTTHSRMRALIPLVFQQKWDTIGSPSYRTQCMQGWGLKCLAWGGNRM